MNTKYISNFFTGAIFSGLLLLVLFGISATQINAQSPNPSPSPIFVDDANPTCATLNADNARFPSITSNNGFSTGTAPNQNPKTYTIPNIGTVTVEYNSNSDIDFQASGAFITAVIVKAGSGANAYVYNPATANGGPLVTPLNNGGQQAGLSHLVFCYQDVSLGTTAATAMIAGRVQVNTGKFRGTVLVTVLNTRTLETQAVFTNRLGYYQFDDLQVGDTYVVTIRSKGYIFTPQTFTLIEDSAFDMFGMAASRFTP